MYAEKRREQRCDYTLTFWEMLFWTDLIPVTGWDGVALYSGRYLFLAKKPRQHKEIDLSPAMIYIWFNMIYFDKVMMLLANPAPQNIQRTCRKSEECLLLSFFG